jgi:hypothetical protein
MTHPTIDTAVTQTSPGIYVLDRSSQGSFTVAFVGRADADVNAALHRLVGSYRFFKYAYCSSAQDAFEAECHLFHDHHPLDNPGHPENQSSWKCPRCEASAGAI